MTPFPETDRVALIAQERALRIDRVGEYIASNILTKLNANDSGAMNLEIGCGHGHWLTSLASQRGEDIFVGIDLLSKRIRKSDRKKELLNISNIFFLKAEANEFLESIPKNIFLKNIYVMYPDPWPKKRHHKNRLIQNSFLQTLREKSRPGSKLFFKTDHKPYFDWTKNVLTKSSAWVLGSDDWPHDGSSYFEGLFKDSYSCSATCV